MSLHHKSKHFELSSLVMKLIAFGHHMPFFFALVTNQSILTILLMMAKFLAPKTFDFLRFLFLPSSQNSFFLGKINPIPKLQILRWMIYLPVNSQILLLTIPPIRASVIRTTTLEVWLHSSRLLLAATLPPFLVPVTPSHVFPLRVPQSRTMGLGTLTLLSLCVWIFSKLI
jgi:hypothetical protein